MGQAIAGMFIAFGLFLLGIAFIVFKAVLHLGVGILVGYILTLLPGVGEALEVGPITESMIPIIVGWMVMFSSFFKPSAIKIRRKEEE